MQGLRTHGAVSVAVGRWFAAALLAAVVLGGPALGRAAEDAPGEWLSEVTAGGGDSWTTIRGRMCPIETLQNANPDISRRSMRPGDVIRSPMARADQTQKQAALQKQRELETRLSEEMDRRTHLEARVATFENLQRDLASSQQAATDAKRTSTMLVAGAAVALALFAIALVLAFAARQESERVSRRLADSEERYNDLRRSLQSLEVQLQKRMLELIGVHRGNVTEDQIGAATLSVIEMAERLKRRHAS